MPCQPNQTNQHQQPTYRRPVNASWEQNAQRPAESNNGINNRRPNNRRRKTSVIGSARRNLFDFIFLFLTSSSSSPCAPNRVPGSFVVVLRKVLSYGAMTSLTYLKEEKTLFQSWPRGLNGGLINHCRQLRSRSIRAGHSRWCVWTFFISLNTHPQVSCSCTGHFYPVAGNTHTRLGDYLFLASFLWRSFTPFLKGS